MAILQKKEGGMPRTPYEKKGVFKFIEVYGRRMWQLMGLNLIYLISIIPIVTFGPATAAMTKVCRNWSQERNAFLWADYKEAFRKNFKQGFIMGLIDIVVAAGFSVAIPSYSEWAKQTDMMYIPLVISLACCIVFFMMHFYIYLMIVSTNLSLGKIIKNAFFLVSLGIKSSLWTLIVLIAMAFFVVAAFPASLFVVFFWPFTFICFVNCFNCYPVIRKFVIQPYYDQRGEENPEFDYLKNDEEALFEDMGAYEPKETKKEKKKKPKTIS
jgi:uncharacterized membrane protein YesL